MLCQTLSSPLPCSFCATIDQLQITDDGTLHYCGFGQFNCSGLIPVKQNFTINNPCIDITDCQLFRCRNQCSQAGTCTSLGICDCDQDHYGIDCSLLLTSECVSSPSFPQTCWQTQFLDCRTFQVTITVSRIPLKSETYKLDEITSLEIVPCTSFISEDNLQCDICVDMNNITIVGTQLIGCPTVRTYCNSLMVSENQMDCFPLAEMTELVCNTPIPASIPGNYTDSDVSRTSKTILIVLVCVLAVLMLLGLGYLFLTRYMGLDPQTLVEFSSTQTYIEDEEPLREEDS